MSDKKVAVISSNFGKNNNESQLGNFYEHDYIDVYFYTPREIREAGSKSSILRKANKDMREELSSQDTILLRGGLHVSSHTFKMEAICTIIHSEEFDEFMRYHVSFIKKHMRRKTKAHGCARRFHMFDSGIVDKNPTMDKWLRNMSSVIWV